ncbi:MAG: hypothetical protein IPG48_06825 [Saprospiraceae bacterium]|nr:hypothetical protein [Saprospiraceae bacterium]
MKDNTVSEWADFCFENQQIVSCDQSGTFKDLKEDEKRRKKQKVLCMNHQCIKVIMVVIW